MLNICKIADEMSEQYQNIKGLDDEQTMFDRLLCYHHFSSLLFLLLYTSVDLISFL